MLSLVDKNSTIWLHHYRLGHPSFDVLRYMYPQLFQKLENKKFYCETCEFAKHKRTSFPNKSEKCDTPFYLIHSDIWGP